MTYEQQGMEAYYSRDRDGLLRVLAAADAELAHLRAYIAGNSLGPSAGPSHTGRNEREIPPVCGAGNS